MAQLLVDAYLLGTSAQGVHDFSETSHHVLGHPPIFQFQDITGTLIF